MTREDFLRQEIDKYEKRITTYQAMIAEWKSELGEKAGGYVSEPGTPADSSGVNKKAAAGDDPLSLVHGMIFFRKSQPDAAKAFLEMVGYPLKTTMILEAVEKGGVTVGGKTPATKKTNLYTILHRSQDFAIVKKDTWGLTSWPGVSKKAAQEVEAEGDKKENGKDEATA
jgi:hypothetical protein